MELIKYFFVGSGIGAWGLVVYLTIKSAVAIGRHEAGLTNAERAE